MIRRVLVLSATLWLGGAAISASAQETATYTYDVHGRLVGVSRTTGADTAYAYDGGDSRTSKVTTGGSSAMAEPEAEAAATETDELDVDESADALTEPQDDAAQDD